MSAKLFRCAFCGVAIGERCDGCDLYNAAVHAQRAAAQSLAEARYPSARNAWLNEHGVFAYVDDVCRQVGSDAEAAPFVALTRLAREVAQ